MKKFFFLLGASLLFFCSIGRSQTLPAGFTTSVIGSDWNLPLGTAFTQDGQKVFVWEKDGNLSSYFGAYLLWSPDGKRISIGSQFFDAITGAPIEVFDLSPPDGQIPTPLAWSPDSRYLLTKKSGLIELRNANTGRKVLSVLEIPSQGYGMMSPKVVVNWNAQSNRFAFTDGGSSVYIYKFSQP